MAAAAPGPAPDQAVILAGFGTPPHGALLRRLTADCGRFGFTRVLVIAAPGTREAVWAALASLPALSPASAAEIHDADSSDPLAALRAALPVLDPAFLLLDGRALCEANWLDLVPAAAGRPAVLGLAPGGPEAAGFTCAPDGTLGTGGSLAWTGVALVTRDALAQPAPALDGWLLGLARSCRAGGRAFPAPVRPPAEADIPVRPARPALFLDRDGTLNVDYGYVFDPARLVLIPGAVETVKRANDLGCYAFLVTNQSGVGRGYYSEADALACNAALQAMLRARGAHLDDMRAAFDHPDAVETHHRRSTGWRKPEPGMLIDLMAHWPVIREDSLMVGDKDSDVEAGRAAGVESLHFTTPPLTDALAPWLARRARGTGP